jgi:hypothetical protein
MTTAETEQNFRRIAADWFYIRYVETIDRTEGALKMRLYVDAECFVQVYANVQRQLFSFTLVLNRTRIFGRDCEGGVWHRHPHRAADQHDFSAEGQRAVTLDEFLLEAQQVLHEEGIL